jgi:hypothetical protein
MLDNLILFRENIQDENHLAHSAIRQWSQSFNRRTGMFWQQASIEAREYS